MAKMAGHSDNPEECRVAWFFELDRARDRGDFGRAAEAQQRLEGLGVRVRYTRRRARAEQQRQGQGGAEGGR